MSVSQVFVFLASLLVFNSVYASSSGVGEISTIHSMSNGAVIFSHSGARTTDVPACASSFSGRWVIDATTVGGKVQISVLLTAYASKKNITIAGSGVCDIWSDTETVSYFVIRE